MIALILASFFAILGCVSVYIGRTIPLGKSKNLPRTLMRKLILEYYGIIAIKVGGLCLAYWLTSSWIVVAMLTIGGVVWEICRLRRLEREEAREEG